MELQLEKLKRDNAILKRDMRIIYKELIRIQRTFLPNSLENTELRALIYLIRLLKQR